MEAERVIRLLGLVPHPEGGHYRETWRATEKRSGRAIASAIYFLLKRDEVSAWHRVDATEMWHFYAGTPLELRVAEDGARPPAHWVLGPDVAVGERPQLVVPAGAWQSARSMGDWTLVGCTVTPAFRFEGFELAPDGWEPGRGPSARG
ncbi:MAG TPA: cupin domain-containing protein [Candidatus Limnocylindrales bacterium]|nr:cupin domain-containing protein [Candidatus Limnocylindrales bacterium]